MTPPDLADVLAEVNRLRAERDMDPLDAMPKGERCESGACPLAIALGSYCVGPEDYATEEDPDVWVLLPPVLREFRRAFDERRAYLELVA